jgi:putative ABC transport system substrate-binding protein
LLTTADEEIRRAGDIASSFDSLKADALYVTGDPLFNANRIRINTFALSARLPTVYPFREFVEAGGLMSYGANIPDLFRRAAGYVDRIPLMRKAESFLSAPCDG